MAKSRIFNRNVNLYYTLKRWQLVSGVWTLRNQASGVASGWSSAVGNYGERYWDNTPNWKTFRATNGYLPTRHMTETWARFTQMSYGRVRSNDGTWMVEQDSAITHLPMAYAPGYISYGGAQSAAFVDPAKVKALAKARDMKVNVAVAFGEGRQTTRMIADAARKLGTAYSAFRKGNFKKAAKTLGIDKPSKSAANHWLEYSYGWKPLLSDVVGAAETAAQHLELGGRPPRFGVSAGHSGGTRTTSTQGNFGSLDYVTYTQNRSHTWEYRARAGLLLEVTYSESALAAQLGFGLTDPLLTAWELVPFSFVFDWFIDVGGWLESMSALQGFQVLNGFESFSQNCTTWTTLSDLKINGLPSHAEQGMSIFKSEQRQYNRDPWYGALPPVQIHVADALNARRIVTSASLWRQRCSGDRKPGAYHP